MNKDKWLKEISFCEKRLKMDVVNRDFMVLNTDKLDSGDNCFEEDIPKDVTKYYEAEFVTKKFTYYINPVMDYVQIYTDKGKQETIAISKLKFDDQLMEIIYGDN